MTGGHERRRARTRGLSVCVGTVLSLIAAACGGGSPQAVGTHRHSPKPGASKTTTTSAPSSVTTTSGAPSVPTTGPANTTTSSVPVTHPGTAAANFKGIYEFAGDNSAADAGDPDLTGVDLVYYWSQIEPEKGVFDWSQIQSDMAPWIAAHKKVILRISTSGAASWDPPYSGERHPGVGLRRRGAFGHRQRRDRSRLLGPGLPDRLPVLRAELRSGV